ncbi:MAG: ROK family transcriptional regulator [bacterium]
MTRSAATRPDAIRRQNLQALLAELHHHGELSRAELTQRLGLNRSTIGALVAELRTRGLVCERAPDTRRGAGRPSYLVGPRPGDGPYALAIDIDVRQYTVAAVGLGGRVLARRSAPIPLPTPPVQHVVTDLARACAALRTDLPLGAWAVGIGVSVPGTVRRHDGRVLVAPNLDWHDLDLAELIRMTFATDLPVTTANDADLAALAEHLRGAARGVDDVLYIQGRVGVGGGVIADGVPMHGALGLAGEIGHMTLDPNGPRCHCGNRGCFETFVGEEAILRRGGRSEPVGLDGVSLVVAAAAAGDPVAIQAVAEVSESLGLGLASLANVLNPAVIVIGGFLAALAEHHLDLIRAAFADHMRSAPPEDVEIRVTGLGADAALLGAAEVAFSVLLSAPADLSLLHRPAVAPAPSVATV